MSEETAFQSVAMVVTRVLCAGVTAVSGLTSSAAVTSVTAVLAELRLYHETFNTPFWFELRRAGRKCHPPVSMLSLTGELVVAPRLTREKLCKRMSPTAWKRASFQTILMVPLASLTATRGKSFIGKRL